MSTENSNVDLSCFSYLNNYDTAAAVLNADGVVILANSLFLEMFGLSEKQVIGKMSHEEACETNLSGTKDCPVTKSARLKKTVSEQLFHRQDKDFLHLRYTATPHLNGKVIESTVITLLDISEQVATRNNYEQAKADLDVIPTPIFEIDTLYNITYINPAAAGVSGKHPDECIGLKCFDLFNTPHCKTEKCACARAMKTDSVVTEQTIARPDRRRDHPDQDIPELTDSRMPKATSRAQLEYVLDQSLRKRKTETGCRRKDQQPQHHSNADHVDRYQLQYHFHESSRGSRCRKNPG